MQIQDKFNSIIAKNNSLVCIGLDKGNFEFDKKIIDATYDLVCAYKPNSAFYEAENFGDLKKTIDYIRQKDPDIVVILDAKRGDIGNTNQAYVKAIFDNLGADAVTVHPYLGKEALQPFLERADKGIFVLVRTSNFGAGEFQDLVIDGQKLYQIVAKKVVTEWNKNNNCFFVVGATYPEELADVRKIAGDMMLLVPGIGAQGGDVEKTVKAGLDSKGTGMIINSSRGIIFAENPREEAEKLKSEINKYRL